MGTGVILQLDATELNEKLGELKRALGEEGYRRLMTRTFREVGRKSKNIIYKAVNEKYVAKRGFVYRAIKSPKIGSDTCIIPVSGPRGGIGSEYTATGSAPGWKIHAYDVNAKILRAGASKLPHKLASYGSKPPFRNSKAKKGGFAKNVFTRSAGARFPVEKVAGIAVAQMPLNRAENRTADELLEYAEKRLEHNFVFMFKG